HFVHGRVGMLQNVKLVVHDAALRRPLLDAQSIRLPHIHADSLDALPLKRAKLFTEEFVQGFLFALPSKPQSLARIQVAYHRKELLFLSQMDLVHAHLPQRRFPPRSVPALQVTQIDAAYGALCQPKLPGDTARRRALTGLPYSLFEAFAKACLARQ